MADFTWRGDAIRKQIEAEVSRRLDAAAITVTNHVRQMISREGAGKSRSGKLIYGAHSSKPGEPPRKQTGRLAASMAWERNGLEVRVGTSVKYAPWLEFGTVHMSPRPFLHRALREKADEVRRILSRPITL